MGGFTTNFDVLEESLGFSLLPQNRDRIEGITFDDVSRMANMIHDHVHSEYFAMPLVEGSVGVCNPLGGLGGRLGGYSRREGTVIDGTAESLVGNVYFSLLTNDCLALPDGLQYVLDYYYLVDALPLYHDKLVATIRKVLTAYADFGPLFHAGHLIIVPSDVYDRNYSRVNSGHGFDAEFFRQFSRSPIFEGASQRIGYTAEMDAERVAMYPMLSEDEFCRIELAKGISATNDVTGLLGALAVAESFGYRPIVHGETEEAVMDALVEMQSHDSENVSACIATPESAVLLPHLGRLPVSEFAALKTSGEAEFVARTISDIERRASELVGQPIARREMVNYELTKATAALDKTIRSSHVLSEFGKEATKVGVGFVTMSTASMVLIPDAASSPLRLLLSGVCGSAGSLTAWFLQKRREQGKGRSATQAFIKIKDTFNDK